MEHFYQNIDGWSQDSKIGKLFDTILEFMPNEKLKIAEIGVYKGRGTALINVNLINKNISYEYYAIDHFLGSIEFFDIKPDEHKDGIDYYPIAYENLKPLLDNYKNIKLIKNDSILESKNYEDNFFDIIYIDGAHDYESVLNDIIAWLPKIKDNGIMCGDDFNDGWPGVVKAVKENFKEKINVVSDNQWWVKIKK